MEEKIIYEELLNKSEISDFLGFIWGNDSPLRHVGNVCKSDDYGEDCSMYYGAKLQDELVALCGLKLINNKTVELGSLAVHPSFRGQGLTKRLFEWRANVLNKLIKDGYQVITFATIGSDIMNFIGLRMSELSQLKSFPLNLAIGVVPIGKDKVKEVLAVPRMIYEFNNGCYTSTISILSSNRDIYYENLNFIKDLKLNNLYPNIGKTYSIKSENDVLLKLDPIRLAISIIKNKNSKLKIQDEYFNQIQIPVLPEYEEAHKALQNKLSITGFAINENILHVVYSNFLKEELLKILDYFATLKDFNFYKEWVSIMKKINHL